jgi:ubiquinone biosynthesis protein
MKPVLHAGPSPRQAAPACRRANSPWRIWRFFGQAQVKWWIHEDKRHVGKWMKEELSELGPAFIKLGQFLSTRSDLLGKEATSELAKLQDDIQPVPFASIQPMLPSSIFASVEETSIASASIGQVHRARLHDGSDVVIKVQKPCVAQQIKEDLDTLRGMNDMLRKIGNQRASEVDNLLHQYARFLSAELNYTNETKHMKLFTQLLDGLPVIIPHVYEEYSTPYMIVMENVPSTKVTDIESLEAQGIDTQQVAQTLVQIFLYQIVYAGYVHCDPHPGNLGVARDGESIVLYDFGNVIELSPEFRKELKPLVFAVFQKDVDEFVELLCKLKVLRLQDDTEALEVKAFFRYFFDYLETLDFSMLRTSVVQQEMDQVNINLQIDPDFLSLFRVFSLLDGTCGRLDESFNYIEALRPFSEDMMRDMGFLTTRVQRDIQKVQSYPTLLRNTDSNILQLQKRVKTMNQSMVQLQLFALFWVWVDHTHEVLPWFVTAGLYIWWKRSEKP